MRVDTLPPEDLGAADLAAWERLRAACPQLASPYFHPGFTKAVADVRGDVRVLRVEDAGDVLALWPVHRRPDGFARPVGQPLSDQNGPLLTLDRPVDLGQALSAAGVTSALTTAWPCPGEALGLPDGQETSLIEAPDGGAAALAALRAAHSGHFKSLRRRERRAQEAHGEVRAELFGPCESALFDQLIAWKRAQFQRTGLFDVFRPAWTRALLRRLGEAEEHGFGGVLSVRWFGEKPAAIELGLRDGGYIPAWITAYDPEFATLSPGHLLLQAMIAELDAHGGRTNELGVGADHYKKYYATASRPLARGRVQAASLIGAAGAAPAALWRMAENAGLGEVSSLLARTRRRMEIVASAELSPWRRLQGLVDAAANAQTLHAARSHE